MKLTKTQNAIIEDLRSAGYGDDQIADAMCDGAYLKAEGIRQDTAEAVYDHITMRNRRT